LKELMDLCTNLSNKVLDLENEVIEIKSSHKAKIEELESRVEKLEEENMSLTKDHKIFNTRVESLTINKTIVTWFMKMSMQDVPNAGVKEVAKEIVKVQSRQSDVVRKYQALKVKVVLVAQARKNMMIYLKNMAGFKMDFFKGMSYKEIRPLFEEEYNKVQ
nr:hypothetical protein [Tanacetum cinerariifolium]